MHPLLRAAEQGNLAEIKEQITQKRTPIYYTEPNDSRTALFYAAAAGHEEVADYLLAHGAEVNVADSHGWTPLHVAAEKGFDRIASKLLERGANFNAKTRNEETAMSLAEAGGHQKIVELIRAKENAPEQESLAVKNSALRCLGYGYDRKQKVLLHPVIANSQSNIDIREKTSLRKSFIGESTSATLKRFSGAMKATLKCDIDLPINLSGNGQMSGEERGQSMEVVCSFFHLEIAQCALKEAPKGLLPVKTLADFDLGDAYVREAYLTAGYQVNIHFYLADQVESSDSHIRGEGGISLPGVAGFNVDGEALNKVLQGKGIKNISVSSFGFGGYQPIANHVGTWAEALREAQRIENDFLALLPKLHNRSIFVSPHSKAGQLAEYTTLPDNIEYCVDAREEEKPSISVSTIQLHPMKPDLLVLGSKIQQTIGRDEKGLLRNISLGAMLEAVNIIFPRTLKEVEAVSSSRRIRGPAHVTSAVLGVTGAGKSTFVANLLGESLSRQKKSTKVGDKVVDRIVLDYDNQQSDKARPEIGHEGSKTKGVYAYFDFNKELTWYDCAGTLDTSMTRGAEMDLCNAMAVKAVFEADSPKAVMMVISSRDVIQNRASVFIQSIQRLKRCVKNVNSERVWSSIVFVINDISPVYKEMLDGTVRRVTSAEVKADILAAIQRSIENYIDDAKSLIKDAKASSWLDKMRSIEGKIQQAAGRIEARSPESAARLYEIFESLEMLKLLQAHPENLIVTNFPWDVQQTEKAVLAKLRPQPYYDSVKNTRVYPSGPNLQRGSFTPECLYEDRVPNTVLTFKTALSVVAAYFNRAIGNAKQYENQLVSLNEELDEVNKTLHALSRESHYLNMELVGEKRIQSLKRELESTREKLGEENDSIDVKSMKYDDCNVHQKIKWRQREQKEYRDKITQLKNDETSIELATVNPKEPITARSWWAWGFLAKQYLFEHSEGIEIEEVKEITATKGSFKGRQLDKGKGTYSSKYKPEWHGKNEDADARVKVFVQKKNHPGTKTSISEYKAKLKDKSQDPPTGIKPTIKALVATKQGLEADIKRYQGQVDNYDAKRDKKVGLELDMQATELRQKSIVLNLRKIERNQAELLQELACYQDFCRLLADVVQLFGYNKLKIYQDIFDPFVEHFARGDLMAKLGVQPDKTVSYSSPSSNRYSTFAYPVSMDELAKMFFAKWEQEDSNAFRQEAEEAKTPAQELRRVVADYGLGLKNVPGDGNCFLYALVDQIKSRCPALPALVDYPDYDYKQLRALAVEALLQSETLNQFTNTPDELIAKISKDQSWCDDFTISTLASRLDVTLVLIYSDGREPHVINAGKDNVVYLGYEMGLHFQSLTGDPSPALLSLAAGEPVFQPAMP